MELDEFLTQTHAEVNANISERLGDPSTEYPYPESIFSEIIMQHMSDIGMTFDDPVICHFERKVGTANLRLSGYALSDETDQLDLFVSLFTGEEAITSISDSETKKAAEQCLHFLTRCVNGLLSKNIDESDAAYPFIYTIQECYHNLDQIRIYVLTDRVAKSKNFKAREISSKQIKLEVMDIERLHRHWSEGKPRDELVINFEEISGDAIPCVYVPNDNIDYDYALTAIPGEALRFVYDKYGARLLEANVRSFLNALGKVNKGIRDTLIGQPENFMAYNNGIVIVADEIALRNTADGGPGILWLKGVQIVNGGQTTASLYFTKKKFPDVNLSNVRIPAKVIILRNENVEIENDLIASISRYANFQNVVRQSDLSANAPYHVEIEKLSQTIYCPDGIGRWFYERAAGSYNTSLAKEGGTPARIKHLKKVVIPPARKIIKTDLAKFINAWDQKPYLVSLGAQKNFKMFMDSIDEKTEKISIGVPEYKEMIAKAILFKTVIKLVRPLFPAFQGNVGIYLVSLLTYKLGSRIDLKVIWNHQDISEPLRQQLATWAYEVNKVLHDSSNGRMISEWAKKPECWKAVKAYSYTQSIERIPEITLF